MYMHDPKLTRSSGAFDEYYSDIQEKYLPSIIQINKHLAFTNDLSGGQVSLLT